MDKVLCHKIDYDDKLKEIKNWNISSENKKQIPLFMRDYELGKITGKVGNSSGNLLRNLYLLKSSLENIKTENKQEVEKFLEQLLKDKIKTYNQQKKKYNGKAYALKTKKSILKILSVYLKWKHKEKSKDMCEILNIQISTKKDDIEILTEEEIDKIFNEIKDIPDKHFLIAVLNSGGMRAEEFHNIRYSDIVLPKENEMFVKITIKNQFSKTKGRTIQLYDKRVLPIVKKYLTIRLNEGMKPNDPVFLLTYAGVRKWMQRLGKRVLGKNIHYHMFRHISATRLASELNRQQLCIYFGWNFSSPMPDIYIQRAGVTMDDVESKFKNTNYEEQQKEILLLKEQHKDMKESLENLSKLAKNQNKLIESLNKKGLI